MQTRHVAINNNSNIIDQTKIPNILMTKIV